LRSGRKAEGEEDIAAAVALQPNVAETFKAIGLEP
jgi:hypothetical protein